MKNAIVKIFIGKSSKLSVLLVLGVFMLIGLGCFGGRGSSKSTTPIPATYYGDWVGQDGTAISIRADGTGDYHSGGTKVDGGTAEINDTDKTLSITFFGIGKTLHIDEAPSGDKMTLDKVVFRRTGSSTTTTTPSSSPTTTSSTGKNPFPDDNKSNDTADKTPQDGTPSDNEVETLVKETVANFADAVDQGDFSNFRRATSKDFQATYTSTQLDTNFQTFIDNKDKVLPSLRGVDASSAKFSSPPHLRTEKGYKILVAGGDFPTSPRPVHFETEYEMEKGTWKLLIIRIQI